WDHGTLRGMVTGRDPYWVREGLSLDPEKAKQIRLRLRVTGSGLSQLWWASDADARAGYPFNEARSIRFDVPKDGKFHDVLVPVGTHPLWKGAPITHLRIDPDDGPVGSEFALAELAAVGKETTRIP